MRMESLDASHQLQVSTPRGLMDELASSAENYFTSQLKTGGKPWKTIENHGKPLEKKSFRMQFLLTTEAADCRISLEVLGPLAWLRSRSSVRPGSSPRRTS